jgi:hypothetical protein
VTAERNGTPDALSTAAGYVNRGWSPVPIPFREKGPRIQGWQSLRLTRDQLAAYFRQRCNVGVILGAPSGGLVDIDLDHPTARELAGQYLPPTGAIFGRASNSSSHWLYIVRGSAPTKRFESADGTPIVEFRADGGQTVFPGSTHPSGERIEWEVDGQPAAVDRDELLAAVEALYRETCRRDGLDAKEPAPATVPLATCGAGGLDVVGRARKYLSKIPPAVSGQGGHPATFHAACALILGFALDRETTLKLLTEWNQSCSPPWSDKELAHKIDDALKQPGERGYLLARNNEVAKQPAAVKPAIKGATVEPYRPFPVEALPEPIRGFVSAVAKAIGCDPCFIALPVLTVLAAAIGNTRRLRLKRSWNVTPIIWAAIMGYSGTQKSPAFMHAMKPIRERHGKAIELHQAAMQEYERAVVEYQRDLSAWTKSKSVGEPPTKPQPPECERIIVSDTTVEALAPILLANPRGLLLERDELNGWIGSFDRYSKAGKGGADSANWLSMFNAGPITVDRKTGSPRTIYVPSAAICVCGGIQPAIFDRALGTEHRESGLLARHLLACPPRQPKRWTEADVSREVERDYARIVDVLFALQQGDTPENPAVRPLPVKLSPDAKAIWKAYYNAHGEEHADLVGDLAAAWSKLEEYAARLALVVHFARWAAGDPVHNRGDVLDAESMQAGIVLVERFKHEARRVYAILGESVESRNDRLLVEWLQRRAGEWLTANDVRRRCRWLREPGTAEAALARLFKAERIDRETVPSGQHGGRSTVRYQAVSTPSTVYETPLISEENEGSVDVVTIDEPEFDNAGDDADDDDGPQLVDDLVVQPADSIVVQPTVDLVDDEHVEWI